MNAQTIASRYRVLRELGRGGMGVVYLVEHLGTGDQLALKLLLQHTGASPEMVERFKREARAPARIKSAHVVKVLDADVAHELGGAPFLVMELLEGRDLEKEIEARGRMPSDEVVAVLRQTASALDKAHAIGITHRDLKPENLFLHRRENDTPILKILDFGISKMHGIDDIASAGLTKSGAMMGTPLYMSPEQARGRVHLIGPPTDVWAVGLIAYRLLTGSIYWQAETIAELMSQIIAEPMVPPSQRATCPAAFDRWFQRSTDRDPSQRFQSVGEQVAALAELVAMANSNPPQLSRWRPADPVPFVASSSPGTFAHTTGPLARSGSIAEAARPQLPWRGGLVLAGSIALGALGGLVVWGRSLPDRPSRATATDAVPRPTEKATPKATSTATADAAPLEPAVVALEPKEVFDAGPPSAAAEATSVIHHGPKASGALPRPAVSPATSVETKAPEAGKKYDPTAP